MTRTLPAILVGGADASASALAEVLPVSRQAIAKHLALLQDVGLVERCYVPTRIRHWPS
ncbi:helix-turn-helix domain-containing protein [Cryobacterium algoricola]|uniref:helix-turn-helix domain-containing protein n=1 Tax=Cryobacterium algoricola TaxID=1259183 RepID=UPI001F54341D|nr:helix-turn-helix domain-containing protein [Cryobacterium algoricola]